MRNRHGVYFHLKTSSNKILFSVKVRKYFHCINFKISVSFVYFFFFFGPLREFCENSYLVTSVSQILAAEVPWSG